MTKNLHQEFIIHPVGQGLFYSGKITYKNQTKFRMVFDCGSLTGGACQEEVKLYRDSAFLAEKQIDLLAISHFDADHVNQIGSLLAGGIKVKKLVMPFLTFEERLFLVLRYLHESSGATDNDFYLSIVIDPIGTLGDSLDGDSEVFLIEGNPNGPNDSDENNDNFNESGRPDFEGRFEFDFAKSKNQISTDEEGFKTSSGVKIFKVDDTEIGTVSSGYLKLMDFLFYKRKINGDDAGFYAEVARLFYKLYGIDPKLPVDKLLEAIVEQIKKIKSAPKIQDIFEEAKKTKAITGIKLKDLNTTALCMLHRNLRGILKLSSFAEEDRYWYHRRFHEVYTIHKFSAASRIETQSIGPHYWIKDIGSNYRFIFPNVLLTSDTFLLDRKQVDPFIVHFQKYWDDFWLFQIPHHGSENNSDDILHSFITNVQHCFINYGVGNRDGHPSPSVIHNLVTTGNSSKLLPVNQFIGLRFALLI